MSQAEIVKAIAVTAELTGATLSGPAIAIMAKDLLEVATEDRILAALTRCRRELTGKLSPGAVMERLQQSDNRPSANEAWGIAMQAFDEAQTVVLNDEIAEAMGVARGIMQEGDEVGARMAFRDAYERIVRDARECGTCSPRWYPSLGHDPLLRIDAIKAAEDRGLLTHSQACAYLPAPISAEDQARGAAIAGLLTGAPAAMPRDPEFKERLAKLASMLKKPAAA